VRLVLTPITLSEANEFIKSHHRHHKAIQGWKFGVAVSTDNKVVGVATVGRPVARFLDDGLTLEVTRLCTDGTRNACSILYGACRRATFALGYKRLITYILHNEKGISLKASGWRLVGEKGGGSWDRKLRPRIDKHPLQKKLLFEVCTN